MDLKELIKNQQKSIANVKKQETQLRVTKRKRK